jgi:hypothetical protein
MALRIGELLIKTGVLTEQGLARALEEQQRTPGQRIGEVLVRLGLVDEVTLIKALARQLGLLRVELEMMPPAPREVIRHVPEEVARRLKVVPLHVKGNTTLGVVMTDPSNEHQVSELARITGLTIEAMISTPTQIDAFIERSYPKPATPAHRAAGSLPSASAPAEAHEHATPHDAEPGPSLDLTRVESELVLRFRGLDARHRQRLLEVLDDYLVLQQHERRHPAGARSP